MLNFKFIVILLCLLSFGSCQKNELFIDEKIPSIETTLRNIDTNIAIPSATHFNQMSLALNKLNTNDEFVKEINKLTKNGYEIIIQKSILVNIDSIKIFDVLIPIYKNNEIEYAIVYTQYNELFKFGLVKTQDIDNVISDYNQYDFNSKSEAIKLISGINTLFYVSEGRVDTIYNNFINSLFIDSLRNIRLVERGCYTYMYPIITYVFGSHSHFGESMQDGWIPHSMEWVTSIWCDEIVYPTFIGNSDPYDTGSGGIGSNMNIPPSNLIDLDCWRNGITASAQSEIYKILNEYIDPCNSDNIESIINNVLIEACTERIENPTGTENSFLESLEDAVFSQDILNRINSELEKIDKIIPDPSFSNCKNLKCVFDYLELSGSKLFCNNIYKFGTSDILDLTIRVENIPGFDGSTKMSANAIGVIITFDDNFCNSNDFLYIAETILHESQHAAFKYNLASNSDTQAEYKAKFLKWVNEKYGVEYTEDQLMILTYMEKSAEELWILNGKKFDKSYYMAWVWDGLSTYWPNKFPESKIQEWNEKRELINQNNPFQCH